MKAVIFVVLFCLVAQCAEEVNKSMDALKPRSKKLPLNFARVEKGGSVLDTLWQTWKGVEDVMTGETSCSSKCTECYNGLGCFDACNGTFHYVRLLPQTPEQVQIAFRLFPWYDNETTILLNYSDVGGLNSTIFDDQNRSLLIVNHGFAADANSDWMVSLKNAVIEYRQHNVILIDWLNGAGPYDFLYPLAVVNTELVGRQVAVLLYQLMLSYSLLPSTIHYVGHSLGAQCAHFCAEYLSEITGGMRMNRITALDAASPLFEVYGVGLNSSDADYVVALHTSSGDSIITGKLGVVNPVGKVDFYLNGGTTQPGCWELDPVCAHTRVHEYYVEAVLNQLTNSTCKFTSYSCDTGIEGYRNGTCFPAEGNFSHIGYEIDFETGDGVQFLETNSSAPFCLS